MEKHSYHSYRSYPYLSPEMPKVLIATGNQGRVDGFFAWLQTSGLPYANVEVVNGWEAEPGTTAEEKAAGKVAHALDVYTSAVGDPRQALIAIAADSVNIGPDGNLREKPKSDDVAYQYKEEWLKATAEFKPIMAESGTAVTIYQYGKRVSASSTDRVNLQPIDTRYIKRAFKGSNGSVYENAHGLGAYPGIRRGQIVVTAGSCVIAPNEAIARIQGIHDVTLHHLMAHVLSRSLRH